jgi:DNA mismatch repair protein MutS
MSSDSRQDSGWAGYARSYWLPPSGTDNGLSATAWAPIADLSQGEAYAVLHACAVARVAAFISPRDGSRPQRCAPTYRVWVDSQRFGDAEDVIRRVVADTRSPVKGPSPRRGSPRWTGSVLSSRSPADQTIGEASTPASFRDQNLDQIVAAVLKGKDEYHLAPLFSRPLHDTEAIAYRQEVFQDLERPGVHQLALDFAGSGVVAQFAYRTKEMREDDHGLNHYHRARFFLNTVEQYCEAVNHLSSGLAASDVRSRGLRGLRDYLGEYVSADSFVALQDGVRRLEASLAATRYILHVRGDRVTVGPYDDEVDYGEQVAATFERFQVRAAADHLSHSREWESYAGTGVLDLVANLYPEVFSDLDRFCAQNLTYLDPAVSSFDRDIQFYLSYLDYISPLRAAGLNISYPRLSRESKDEQAWDTFDLALAMKLNTEGAQVVCNDITLTGPERILVISGPNNGGKTTLARTFGQLHFLASLGCPVPGRDVQLFACDQILTHFERAERITTLAGKLQDELNRLHADLQRATPASVIILNEMFSSTSAQDALFLSQQILGEVAGLDALCVCVTFLDELASLNEKTVSMVSTVVPEDPAIRTHKLIRKPADGRAYAQAIAEKYGLSFASLAEELTR